MARKKLTKRSKARPAGRKKRATKASGAARKKSTRKKAAKKAARKRTRRRASAPDAEERCLARSIGDLKQKLEAYGVRRAKSAVGRWVAERGDFGELFGRPSDENPVDVAAVAAWARQLPPNPADAPAQPPGAAVDRAEDDLDGDPADPYAPPSPEQLRRLRRRNPKEWAEALRLMAVFERERIKNDTARGKLLPREQVERENTEKISTLKNAMRQAKRATAPRIADLVAERMQGIVTKKKARELERLCGKLEGEVEDVLEHVFETVCNAYADGDRHGGG